MRYGQKGAEKPGLIDVLVVEVKRVLSHCPKCMIRSALWEPSAWPDTTDLPTFAETLKAHAKLAKSVEEVQAIIDTEIESGCIERGRVVHWLEEIRCWSEASEYPRPRR